jgi:GntR family transcriptional regulator, transcriptional repressor for pyruvate dehydrogenase complex
MLSSLALRSREATDLGVEMLFARDEAGRPGARAATLSAQIVAEVRDALFQRRLKPGDFLGGEKDIAQRAGVSRIVARDALRTLAALGVVDIRMGAGGGARIARGSPQLFAEALAVQLALTGVAIGEIMDAQRAVECEAAALAAERSSPSDRERLAALIAEAEKQRHDLDAFTRLSRDFHLSIAEASQNRVLVFQLISLQHVSWPRHNRTLTPEVAARILAAHRALAGAIAGGDSAAARRLMDEHVHMIRARRTAEHGESDDRVQACC